MNTKKQKMLRLVTIALYSVPENHAPVTVKELAHFIDMTSAWEIECIREFIGGIFQEYCVFKKNGKTESSGYRGCRAETYQFDKTAFYIFVIETDKAARLLAQSYENGEWDTKVLQKLNET